MMTTLYVVVLSILCFISGEAQSASEEELRMAEAYNLSQTIKHALKNYDKNLRPNAGGKPVDVLVEFKVISFGELREVSMEYDLDIFFRQWWNDPRLRNNFSMAFNMAADPNKMIWTPDTYFWNVKKALYHRVTRENMRLKISPDGGIYFSTRITLTVHCDMDLRIYPMDTQRCPLVIESYAHTVEDVNYHWKGGTSPGIEIASREMSQFIFNGAKTFTKASINSKGSFASLKAVFSFRRRLDYYISSVYVPEIVLVTLSWCTFFITPVAIPARTALSITTILTTILLSSSVNENIPKVSYMKAVDYFLLISFGFIFWALGEYILVLNTPNEFKKFLCKVKRHKSRPPQSSQEPAAAATLKDAEEGHANKKEQPENKPTVDPSYHWVDMTSRFVFFLCYVTFLLAYVIYYKNVEE